MDFDSEFLVPFLDKKATADLLNQYN